MSKIYNKENYEDMKEGELLCDNYLKTKWQVLRLVPGGAVLKSLTNKQGGHNRSNPQHL